MINPVDTKNRTTQNQDMREKPNRRKNANKRQGLTWLKVAPVFVGVFTLQASEDTDH